MIEVMIFVEKKRKKTKKMTVRKKMRKKRVTVRKMKMTVFTKWRKFWKTELLLQRLVFHFFLLFVWFVALVSCERIFCVA